MRQCETFILPQVRCHFCTRKASMVSGWITNGQNPAIFDRCNLTNMQLWLNHSRYPSVDMATDFAKEQYASVYKSFYDFASRYYGMDNLLRGSATSPVAFKSLYPIHMFDASKQSDDGI